jgi:DNA polymerase-1
MEVLETAQPVTTAKPVIGRLLVVDVMAMVYRAFYAIPEMRNQNGLPINAVQGFSTMLVGMLERTKPEYVVMAFEGGSKRRKELLPEYKATRKETPAALVEQMPLIKDFITELLGIEIMCCERFEADDVIAAIVRNCEAKHKNFEVFISTGDKDILQLIRDSQPSVKVLLPGVKFSDVREFGVNEVVEKYGFTPDRLPFYLALTGDKIDNIPGIPSVGEVTAKKLIGLPCATTPQSLVTACKDNLFGPKPDKARKELLQNSGQLYRNLELTTLTGDIPGFTFEPGYNRPFDSYGLPAFARFFKEHGLSGAAKWFELYNNIYCS